MRNQSEIQKIVEKVVPLPEARTVYLSMFADACVEAGITNSGNWAVTDAPNAIRLQVGHYIVFTIIRQRAWLALDYQLIETRQKAEVDFSKPYLQIWIPDTRRTRGGYPQYKDRYKNPFSLNGYYFFESKENHNKTWPHLRRLHFALLSNVSILGQPIQSRTRKRHNPAILDYLRAEFSRHIHDPAYQT